MGHRAQTSQPLRDAFINRLRRRIWLYTCARETGCRRRTNDREGGKRKRSNSRRVVVATCSTPFYPGLLPSD